MVPCAWLRVFEPLDAFGLAEQRRWRHYLDREGGVTVRRAVEVEERVGRDRILRGRWTELPGGALVRRVGTRVHVCPLHVERRAARGWRELTESVPPLVLDALVPDLAEQELLDGLVRADAVAHIRDAAWAVPLTWFVLFDSHERHLVDPPEGDGPRLTYLTGRAGATARLDQVRRTLAGSLDDVDGVVADLDDLASWLGAFDERAIVELDYGGLTSLVDRGHLATDRTCEDLWAAVEALEHGDLLGAAAYYGVARSRWAQFRDRRTAS